MTKTDDTNAAPIRVQILDYGKGDHAMCVLPVPSSPPEIVAKAAPTTGWGWREMRDPVHQQFREVAALTDKQRMRFATHILGDARTRAISENITVRLPGSPIFLPRELKRSYQPVIEAAMEKYRHDFDLNRAVIALQVRMGVLEPSTETGKLLAPLQGAGMEGRATSAWRNHFSANYPHIDGGSVEDIDNSEINPTNRWFLCFNKLSPIAVSGQPIAPKPHERNQDYIRNLPNIVPPENLQQGRPFTVIEVDPLSVHWAQNAQTSMFRHLASVRIYHPEDFADVEASRTIPGFRNKALDQWFAEHQGVVRNTLAPVGKPAKKLRARDFERN